MSSDWRRCNRRRRTTDEGETAVLRSTARMVAVLRATAALDSGEGETAAFGDVQRSAWRCCNSTARTTPVMEATTVARRLGIVVGGAGPGGERRSGGDWLRQGGSGLRDAGVVERQGGQSAACCCTWAAMMAAFSYTSAFIPSKNNSIQGTQPYLRPNFDFV
ncbi:unnamed protein product [Cuscuta campestris]|uniref:Uncharacterized protein n=1 Tax=Cuscuta campestris TaxID=132261 RepID=A0A484L160_9ASTE|nr:unnamed protein product [Cuscuta campestris]